MKKTIIKMCQRGIISFAFGVTVNIIIVLGVTLAIGDSEFFMVVPDFAAYFTSPLIALLVQALLTGFISAVFGACSVIYDIERWSFFKQGIVHFLLTAVFWAPIAAFMWGAAKYRQAFISIFCSFCFTYAVTWICQYQACKKNIRKINERLVELNEGDRNQ